MGLNGYAAKELTAVSLLTQDSTKQIDTHHRRIKLQKHTYQDAISASVHTTTHNRTGFTPF